jgi:hypothetical protein
VGFSFGGMTLFCSDLDVFLKFKLPPPSPEVGLITLPLFLFILSSVCTLASRTVDMCLCHYDGTSLLNLSTGHHVQLKSSNSFVVGCSEVLSFLKIVFAV